MATHKEPPGFWRRPWRAVKTLFFLFSMVGSLLVFSAPPLLVAILDIVVPTTILNASSSSSSALSLTTILMELRSFEFEKSLVDVPLLSVARSLLILCVYSACDVPGRSRGPYLGVTTLCSVASAAYVAAKASVVFGGRQLRWQQLGGDVDGLCAEAAMVVISVALAVVHLLVAYRTSRRERRKLLVYRIDLEAVPPSKIGLDHHKS